MRTGTRISVGVCGTVIILVVLIAIAAAQASEVRHTDQVAIAQGLAIGGAPAGRW